MKSMSSVLLAGVFAAATVTLAAQDAVKVDPTHYKVVTENAAVRIVRVSYPAGAKSPMHSHPDSVVVILQGGAMRFTAPDGTNTDNNMPNDSAIYSAAGSHANTNMSKGAVDAILIEFKTPKPGTVALPAARPGLAMKVLAEGPRALAYTTVAETSFAEAPGTKHDYDQVVIALQASNGMSLSLDGKPAKTTWARGDVAWIARGTAHEAKNTSGKPVTFAIVAIK